MAEQPSYPSLHQRVVLVTGGASGIGAAIARGFSAQGSRVAVLDQDRSAAEQLREALAAAGAPGLHVELCDLRDITALRRAIAGVVARLGPVQVLVNNAADDERHEFDAVEPAYFDERIQVNLRHYFFAAQAVRPGMAAAGGGGIVNLGSICWKLGFPGLPVYALAKAAIAGMSRTLAQEFGAERIRVNCVEPGFVSTERQQRRWLTPELEAEVRAGQALPDLIEPSAIADMVLFLASDQARMCTGQSFVVDAGWT